MTSHDQEAAAPFLSVIIPVFNEPDWIKRSYASISSALERLDIPSEIVIVDDGSNEATKFALADCISAIPTLVLTQENSGRLAARTQGLLRASGIWAMLLDSRVLVDFDALSHWFSETQHMDARIWITDVHIQAERDPTVPMWELITRVAWRRYYLNRAPTDFTYEDFDRYPKGTTCLVAHRDVLLQAHDRKMSDTSSSAMANDDTAILRPLSMRHVFRIDPDFFCLYHGRGASYLASIRHTFHRGIVLVDGYLRSANRYRPLILAALSAGPVILILLLTNPYLILAGLVGFAIFAGATAIAVRMSPSKALRVAVTIIPFMCVYLAGVYTGVALIIRDRFRSDRKSVVG